MEYAFAVGLAVGIALDEIFHSKVKSLFSSESQAIYANMTQGQTYIHNKVQALEDSVADLKKAAADFKKAL